MSAGERLFVSVVGAVTVGLVLLLAFAVLPGRPWTALAAGAAVCAPFGLIVGLGLRRLRVRQVLRPLSAVPVEADASRLVVNVDADLRRWRTRRARAVRVALVLCPAVGMAFALVLGRFVSVGLGALVGAMFVAMAPLLTSTDRAALKLLAVAEPRAVEVDGEGLRLPIELVTEPAFHLAVEAGEAVVRVDWDEIVRWQVYEGAGDAHAQHLLHVAPSTGRFGPFHRFAIQRVDVLRADEDALLNVARRHLRCAIEVRTDTVGSGA